MEELIVSKVRIKILQLFLTSTESLYHVREIVRKVEEEINELKQAIETNNKQDIEEEFGDVLFSLINYSRFINVDAENALQKVNKKFMKRFNKLEELATQQGKSLTDMSLEEMDDVSKVFTNIDV